MDIPARRYRRVYEKAQNAFIHACHELVRRQQELLPVLAETLSVAPQELYYRWVERSFPGIEHPPDELWPYVGQIGGTPWHWFFHGLECDLRHAGDGRYVRIEFGPRGRTEIVSGYGVLQR